MAPAQWLGVERARPNSGQGVVARHLAEVLKAWNRQQVWKILTAIGPLREGDELILLSQTLPDLSRLKPRDAA